MPNGQPTVVEIEGVGVVEFPAEMSESQVMAQLQAMRRDVQRGQRTWFDELKDVGVGVVQGIGEGVKNAGKAIHAIPGVSQAVDAAYGTPGLSDAAFAEADRVTTPENTAQSVGKMGEQIVEAVIPGRMIARAGAALGARVAPAIAAKVGATAGRVAPRIATEAAAGGAMAAYQGGDPTAGAVLGGAFPAAGAGVRAARNAVLGGVKHTPEMAAAVAYGQRAGIPIDAATATGRDNVATVQKRVSDSLGGAGVAEDFKARQAQALAQAGQRLAADAYPQSVSPETAGRAVRDEVQQRIRNASDAADAAYGIVRQAEAGAVPDQVPVRQTVAKGLPLDRAFLLRWMADDLDEITYQKQGHAGSQYHAEGSAARAADRGNDIQATMRMNQRVGGSPLYQMLEAAGIGGSYGEKAETVRKVLQGRTKNPRVMALADVMAEGWDGQGFDWDLVRDETLLRAGVKRSQLRSPSTMPDMTAPGAGAIFGDEAASAAAPLADMEDMALAVDLTSAKDTLAPILQRLMRKKELTGSLMGAEGRAAQALDALVNGPDHAPLTVVDEALGDLKALARGAAMPELRNKGQGLAAEAVKQLDTLVKLRAEAAGPEVLAALEGGRIATRMKYGAAEVLEMLRDEPVQVFRQAVFARDAGIEQLREVAKLAPGAMPKVGRAYVEELLDLATENGGFTRANKLLAEWGKLGDETKKLLFPNPQHRGDLDAFFRLAAKVTENVNPSGTGRITTAFNLMSTVPAYALAKVLYTPSGVRQLTKGLKSGDPKPIEAALGRVLATQGAQQ
jgi:hypothetical protein